MIIVRDLSTIPQISNVAIRELVLKRIDALNADGFDIADLGYFLVVDPGDTIEAIDAQLGFQILCNSWTGICFGEPGFTPSFELLEEFPACFDLVYVTSDDGAGIELLVPKAGGIDPALLAMCRQYSVPGGT